MRVILINVNCGRQSTGRICADLANALNQSGHSAEVAYGRDAIPDQYKTIAYKIGSNKDVIEHVIISRLFDASGEGSKKATEKLIKHIENFKPDIIHLHNIHGYYLNYRILFEYIKKEKIRVVWTLHDCWPFTGHCAFFDYAQCNKWKNGCNNCPQIGEYPKSFVDRSKRAHKLKELCFTGVENMTLVCPSEWLAGIVEESFLSSYPIKVINNGIDTAFFHPRRSNIKEKYGINDKKILLGVASIWNTRKGLRYFVELSKICDPSYAIVLIGLSEEQIKQLPSNIIGIEHTESRDELAEWYSSAEFFINPTLEDNYPTTNLEAIACNTPVITFNTGGSGESARKYGYVTKEKSACSIMESVNMGKPRKAIDSINDLSIDSFVRGYIELYNEVLSQ